MRHRHTHRPGIGGAALVHADDILHALALQPRRDLVDRHELRLAGRERFRRTHVVEVLVRDENGVDAAERVAFRIRGIALFAEPRIKEQHLAGCEFHLERAVAEQCDFEQMVDYVTWCPYRRLTHDREQLLASLSCPDENDRSRLVAP